MSPLHTVVELWLGELSCPRTAADVFGGDILILTATDTQERLREIPAGDWRRATVYDARGNVQYAHVATTPAHVPVPLDPARFHAWLPTPAATRLLDTLIKDES